MKTWVLPSSCVRRSPEYSTGRHHEEYAACFESLNLNHIFSVCKKSGCYLNRDFCCFLALALAANAVLYACSEASYRAPKGKDEDACPTPFSLSSAAASCLPSPSPTTPPVRFLRGRKEANSSCLRFFKSSCWRGSSRSSSSRSFRYESTIAL